MTRAGRVLASGGETMKPLMCPSHITVRSAIITGSIGQPIEPLVISLGQPGVRCGLLQLYVAAIAVQDGPSYADFTPGPYLHTLISSSDLREFHF